MKNIAQNKAKLAVLTVFLTLAWLAPMAAYAGTPTLSFSITPQSVTSGSPAVISWYAQDVSFCDGSGAWGGHYRSIGSITIFPEKNDSYYIVCNGPYGTVTDVKTLFVNQNSFSSPIVYSTPSYSGSTSGLIPIPTPPIPIAPPSNTFTAACATSPTVTETNKIVSFAAAQTGGFAPIVYRWSGDISGSQQVENIAFEHAGVKTAKITITDSRGLSAEGYCSVTVNSQVASTAPTPVPAPVAAVKKPTVVVTQAPAPTCKTVTLCIDTAGNVTQKDANGETKKEEPKIETAKNDAGNGSNGKKFFLASLFGSGNGNGTNGSGIARNFAVYLLPVLAAACVIFLGYMIVRFSKKA